MLSEKEIDALLQSPKPVVRKAMDCDKAFLMNYVTNYSGEISDELRIIATQLPSYDIYITEDTDAYMAFRFQVKAQHGLADVYFLTLSK